MGVTPDSNSFVNAKKPHPFREFNLFLMPPRARPPASANTSAAHQYLKNSSRQTPRYLYLPTVSKV